MVVRGAGGPGRGAKSGGGSIRVGGRVPWGAKAEFAYRAGYDGMGRVSVTHVVERGLRPEAAGDGSCVGIHGVPHDGRLPRSSLGRPARGRIRESRRGRAFARSSIRLGALPEPDRPSGGGAVRLPSLSAWRRRLGGDVRPPLTTTKRRTTQMNLGGFIDTFKDAIARRVVESYPPLYRPSENGGTLPRLLRKPLGAQAGSGARPSPSRPTGRRRDGHGQDLQCAA